MLGSRPSVARLVAVGIIFLAIQPAFQAKHDPTLPRVGSTCTPVAGAIIAKLDGRHRPRNLSRFARRAKLVREVELPNKSILRIRATRRVPESTVDNIAEVLPAGIRHLSEYLGPAPLDLEFVLVGRRHLPPVYRISLKRKGGPPWIMILVSVFTVPEPGKPSWDDLMSKFHELVHHWAEYGEWFAGADLPRWLEEGTADWVSAMIVRDLSEEARDRYFPPRADWTNAGATLLGWDRFQGDPTGITRRSREEMFATSRRYDLAYHVVKEVWEKDEGKTLVRLLKAFAGKEEVPPPEEQERIFEEIVGEPLEAVIARLAARAPAGEDQAGR